MKQSFIVKKIILPNIATDGSEEYLKNGLGPALFSQNISHSKKFDTYPEAQQRIADIISKGNFYQVERVYEI